MTHTRENIADLSINELLGREIACSCGHAHSIPMKRVLIGSGVTADISRTLRECGYKKALILSDRITWDIAAKDVAEYLERDGFPYETLVLEGRVVPDEARIGEIIIHAPRDADIIIAVGTGVMCDIGKMISYKMGIDTAAVVTAPSVDGFASKHAALVIGRLKVSFTTHCPTIIVGDVDVLKNAPMSMIIAGWCDIMGKFSCLSDWKISHIVNDEYYCETLADMVYRSVRICRDNLEALKLREPHAVQSVMEALVLAGIAMSFIGNSRPASGSEHHLSHCWELRTAKEGKELAPHGIQIGVGEALISMLYGWLKTETVDFAAARAIPFDERAWEAGVHDYFGSDADDILKEIRGDHRYDSDVRARRLAALEKNWPAVLEIVRAMPAHEEIVAMLKSAGTATAPADIHLTDQEAADSIRHAKEVRNKYTVLGVLDDLGLLETYAARIEAK